MNKRLTLIVFLALWVALSAGIIFAINRAGYSLWIAIPSAYFIFVFVNMSLAYKFRVHQLRLEGKEAPPYLQYLFFGMSKPKGAAPRSTHIIVGITTALAGVFFLYCGVALTFDAEWSRITQPAIAATICLVLSGIGVAFLYLTWQIIAFKEPPNQPTVMNEEFR